MEHEKDSIVKLPKIPSNLSTSKFERNKLPPEHLSFLHWI